MTKKLPQVKTIPAGYEIGPDGRYRPRNQGFASRSDVNALFSSEDKANGGSGSSEKKAPKASKAATGISAGGQMSAAMSKKLDDLIDVNRGQLFFLERMFNILQRSPIVNPKSMSAVHNDLLEEAKGNREKNSKKGGFMSRMTGGFGEFFKSLKGWTRVLESVLIPLLLAVVAKLATAHGIVSKLAAGGIAALAFGPTRRLIGKGLRWMGGKTVDFLRGGTKEEFAAKKAAMEAEKASATAAKAAEKPAAKSVAAAAEEVAPKAARKLPARDARGRFVKAAEEDGGLLAKIGKVMPKIAPVLKILGHALVILDIVSTAVEGIKGAVEGYKRDGVTGAIAGGARGIAHGLIGWIWDLGTWVVGSLFKLFGADKIGEAIKAFDFNKLLDSAIGWVANGIQNVVDGIKNTFAGGFWSGIRNMMLAPINSFFKVIKGLTGFDVKGWMAGVLNGLPASVKKFIPSSVWEFLGRQSDGAAKKDEFAQRRAALNSGGEAALNRHRYALMNGGTDYEANMNSKQRMQFEGALDKLRSGKHIDNSELLNPLKAANSSASDQQLNAYLKNTVYQQVRTQAAMGADALANATVGRIGGSGGSFDAIIGDVLRTEGGYVANDAGKGPTNFGINERSNRDLLDQMGIKSVKDMTIDQAKAIYKKKYWDGLGMDAIPKKFQRQLFDISVNMGPGAAKKFIDEIRAGKIKTPEQLDQARKAKYRAIAAHDPSKAKYLSQWLARSDKTYQQSLADVKPVSHMQAPASSAAPVAGAGGSGGGSVAVVNAPTVNNKTTHNHGAMPSAAPPAATAALVA